MCVSRSGALRANGGVGELWLSREAGPAKRIVDGRTKVLYERGGTPLSEAGIAGCSFSPDERSLYFLADKYGTQLRKACTDVSITLEQTPLLDGTTLEVIHLKSAGEGAMPVFAEDFPALLRQWECARGITAG